MAEWRLLGADYQGTVCVLGGVTGALSLPEVAVLNLSWPASL